MSILKLFKRLCGKAKPKPKQMLAFIAVVAMVASLIQPASIAHAADDTGDQRQMEKIESFTGKLVRGATLDDQGRYIWAADHDAEDHKFVFRVDYSLSGVKELAPGAIKIWIPRTILKDRNGKYADEMDLTIPSQEEYEKASKDDQKMVDYIWKTPDASDEKHKNWVEITNVKERTAGENGYFEVSYATTKKTYEYTDMCRSDPFKAEIQVTNTSEGAPQTVTAETKEIPVYINTTAEIRSTIKKYPSLIKTWQPSWGDQPEETKGMWFLVWQVISEIKKPTQYYTFSLEDKPVSDELHLIGYSMGDPNDSKNKAENGPYTSVKSVNHQSSASMRYDYVLTYYNPEHFKDDDQYELENSITATVTPEDKIDKPTSATSKKVWEWDTPKFASPPGHFYGLKFGDGSWSHLSDYDQKYRLGNTEWHPKYGSQECSSYSLDQFQESKKEYLDFAFGFNVYGFPAPWTVKIGGDPFNPDDYQKTPVKYEMTDEELYLHENIKAEDIGADQLKFTIPENARRLTADDYQFMSARWQMHSEWRKFDKDEQKFVIDSTGKYSEDDIVHFWVKSNKTGTDKYTEVASYNLGTGKEEIKNSYVVDSLDGEEIKYKESANVTGIRFTTSNPYWYTNLSATPIVRLKNSKFVMDRVKGRDLVRLYNFSHSDAYDHSGKKLYGLKNYAYDRALRPKRDSKLVKRVVSAGSDKIRKKYVIRWYIREKETVTTDDENLTANTKTEYLTQKSGKFYDLLPKGLHLQRGSIDIETEKGPLSKSSYSYSVDQDYKGSGRDMITVDIPVAAKYYNFYFNSEISWDSIRELGRDVLNPVAYETGNDDIAHGCPDDGGLSSGEKKLDDVNIRYMSRTYDAPLDPGCGEAKRFLYNEEPHNIDTLTAAVSGLQKQIKDSRDSEYSYSTYTVPNGHYSYKIRFANTADRARNLIFYDSLENYNLNGKHSDWHGYLQRFDLSQMRKMGVDPVVYVSEKGNLSFEREKQTDNANEVWYPQLNDSQFGWKKVTDDTDLSKMHVHAFAIDCRKATSGDPFILKENETISAVVYMKAPGPGEVKIPDPSVNEKGEKIRSKAYNNIYIYDTVTKDKTDSTYFIHQDYTEIAYHFSADVRIHKQNARDENEAVEGAKYRLEGTSNYGNKVDNEETTGAQGNAMFEDIEEGTYKLTETYSPADWLTDKTQYEVRVFTEKNENGDAEVKVTCKAKDDGKDVEKADDKSRFIMKDAPRLHGDLVFRKKSTAQNAPIEGAKFRLTGKSYYKNDIVMYATSNDYGKVKFDNVEYGDYKLKEVETPKGFIANPKEYSVSISDTGIGSIIDPDETSDDGTVIIKNEPYHTVEISKQSSYDDAVLSGAEFKLTGTSDYGTPYDKTATSGDNGLAKFDGLEAGTYIIQETKSPKDYFLDSTKHVVKVNKDGSYTIDGLKKNDSNYYRMNNSPEEKGKIVVKKKWKDNKTNDKRPIPVIHITTDINKVPTYAAWRDNYNSGKGPFYYVDHDYQNKVREVKYAKDITSADQVPKNAVRLDKNYDDKNAKCKIWGWLTDDGIMHYWTNAQTTRLTNGSNMMFYGIWGVRSIDLSKIDTSKMTDMSGMFRECCSLTSLDLSHFDTSSVTNMSCMFTECGAESLDLSHFDTSSVTNMSNMFYCPDSSGSYLKSVNLSSWDTSKVTSMHGMFQSCNNLTSIDVSRWDTSNVTDMGGMFYRCYSLTSLGLSSWNTSKVTSMYGMFYDCSSLPSLDMSKFDTSNVMDMEYMFCDCSKLTSLDVSRWNTSKVTNMDNMFSYCSSLPSLDVSRWNTSKVGIMDDMFSGCSSLTSLDVSRWNTSKVWYVSGMFSGCSSLTSLDVMSFDMSKVTNFDQLYRVFFGCSSLTSLDLSSWNTSKVTDMRDMFNGCSSLTSIYVSDKWSTDKVTYSDGMFSGCSKLPNYSSSSTDKTHANYGPDGYLIYKAAPTAKTNTSNISFASRLVSMILSRLAVPAHAADSASYVSTDEKHCKITKDGDTWTYEFSVADDSAKYYAYEESVEGYTSSNDASSYGITTKNEPLTITNTANELPKEPKPASLSLSKITDGKQLVESDKPVEKYSHTSNIDDTGKAGHMYSNNMDTNDIVTIPGASKLHIKLYCSTESTSYDWVCVWAGSHSDYTAKENYSSSKLGSSSGKIGGGSKTSMPATPIEEGDIDGDSVTFGFRSDYSGAYYGYYAVVTGKDSDGKTITHKVKSITDDSPTEDVPSSYSDIAYMFDVTLKNSNSSKLSGTKIFGNTVFTGGKAQVGVKAGETKIFSDLPGGTSYTITEKKYDDFYTESKNASGTLKAGGTAEVKFTNHYQKPKTPDTPKEYSSFTLKKNVTGFFQSAQNYTFDVSFRKLDPNTEYTLSDGTKFTSDADGYGYVQTRLGNGEKATFVSLPVGALYKVTEEGGDWSSAYKIKNGSFEGNISQSADSAEKGQQLSTAWETVDKGEEITANYTNTVKKYQNLILKKAVTGGDAPGKFKFRVDFTDLYETITSDAGTIVPEDDGIASAEVYIGADDQIEFKNVPVTTKYQITELANAGKANYTITTDESGNAHGVFAKASDGNTEAMKDLSTVEETVDEGENATVTFLNDIPKTADVALKKKVAGNFASRTRFFRFTVSLTGADRNHSYMFDLTKASAEHDGNKNTASITTDENGNGSADIWLKHDDTVVIKGLPLSAKYSIAEDHGEYVPSIMANGAPVMDDGKPATVLSERPVAPETIVFTNTSTAILPTGIADHRNAIALACTAIILAVCFAFALLKRKRKTK